MNRFMILTAITALSLTGCATLGSSITSTNHRCFGSHDPKTNPVWIVPNFLKPVVTFEDANGNEILKGTTPERIFRVSTYATSHETIRVWQELVYLGQDEYSTDYEWVELKDNHRLYTFSSWGTMRKGKSPANEGNLPTNELTLALIEVDGSVYLLTEYHLWKWQQGSLDLVMEFPQLIPPSHPGDDTFPSYVQVDKGVLGPLIVLNNMDTFTFQTVVFYNVGPEKKGWQMVTWKNPNIMRRGRVTAVTTIPFNYVLTHYMLNMLDKVPEVTIVRAYGDGDLLDATPPLIRVEKEE